MQFSLPGFRTFLLLTRLAPRAPTLFKQRVAWGKRYAKDSHYSTISPGGSADAPHAAEDTKRSIIHSAAICLFRRRDNPKSLPNIPYIDYPLVLEYFPSFAVNDQDSIKSRINLGLKEGGFPGKLLLRPLALGHVIHDRDEMGNDSLFGRSE